MEVEHQERPPEENIFRRNRTGLLKQQPDGTMTAVPVAEVERQPSRAMLESAKFSLRAAYERYKVGKGFGRQDLFGVVIDELEELKRRIGSVDEAAVSAIGDRVSSLERVIGNALSEKADSYRAEMERLVASSKGTVIEPPKRGRPRTVKPEADNG